MFGIVDKVPLRNQKQLIRSDALWDADVSFKEGPSRRILRNAVVAWAHYSLLETNNCVGYSIDKPMAISKVPVSDLILGFDEA